MPQTFPMKLPAAITVVDFSQMPSSRLRALKTAPFASSMLRWQANTSRRYTTNGKFVHAGAVLASLRGVRYGDQAQGAKAESGGAAKDF
jgi:hypothetical protein